MITKKILYYILMTCLAIHAPSALGQVEEEEEEILYELSPFSVGATVGGAQDIRYFPDQVRLGNNLEAEE